MALSAPSSLLSTAIKRALDAHDHRTDEISLVKRPRTLVQKGVLPQAIDATQDDSDVFLKPSKLEDDEARDGAFRPRPKEQGSSTPSRAQSCVPEAWKDSLKIILHPNSDQRQEDIISPFRNGILHSRLIPLENAAERSGATAVEGVDFSKPFIWSNRDFVGYDVEKVQEAIERAMFGYGNGTRGGIVTGSRYFAGSQNTAQYDPEINLRIMRSFYDPTKVPLAFGCNMVVPEYEMGVQQERLENEHAYPVDTCTSSANYTPQGVSVALHTDLGMAGSAWHGRGPKLWVFYPPSRKNIEILCQAHHENNKYQLLEPQLGAGYYAVVFSTQTVQMPPGWLHATYALGSGFVIGNNWSTAEGLEATGKILRGEIAAGDVKTPADIVPFLRSLHAALTTGSRFFPAVISALTEMCPQKMEPSLVQICKRKPRDIKLLVNEIKSLLKSVDRGLSCDSEDCQGLLSHLP